MDDVLRVLGGIILFVLTIGFWAFTLLFHILSAWKTTAMGKHFMSLMVSCDLILTWLWVGFVFEEIPPGVRAWVRILLYGTLAFVVWRQVRILIKMQIITRDNPKEEVTDGPIA